MMTDIHFLHAGNCLNRRQILQAAAVVRHLQELSFLFYYDCNLLLMKQSAQHLSILIPVFCKYVPQHTKTIFPCGSHSDQEIYRQIGQDWEAAALWRDNKCPCHNKEDHNLDFFVEVHLESFSCT